MAKIRVDQSHCNHHLGLALEADGWTVLFKDAGRVTRGGLGSQGDSLRLFEETGTPIPDIAALRDSDLLLVEVDNAWSKVEKSLTTYRMRAAEILANAPVYIDDVADCDRLLNAFCKIGITSDLAGQKGKIVKYSEYVDLLVVFSEPRNPVILEL